jgi:hypothetical protein
VASKRRHSSLGPRRPDSGRSSYGGSLEAARCGGQSNPAASARRHAAASSRAAPDRAARRALNPASGGASRWASSAARHRI